MIRTVYMIEVYNNEDCILTYRNYARNKKAAEVCAKRFRKHSYNDVSVRKLSGVEMSFISLEDLLS